MRQVYIEQVNEKRQINLETLTNKYWDRIMSQWKWWLLVAQQSAPLRLLGTFLDGA